MTNRQNEYALAFRDKIFAVPVMNWTSGLRIDVDLSKERMQKKIRNAQTGKIPYMLVVGARPRMVLSRCACAAARTSALCRSRRSMPASRMRQRAVAIAPTERGALGMPGRLRWNPHATNGVRICVAAATDCAIAGALRAHQNHHQTTSMIWLSRRIRCHDAMSRLRSDPRSRCPGPDVLERAQPILDVAGISERAHHRSGIRSFAVGQWRHLSRASRIKRQRHYWELAHLKYFQQFPLQ
jgi:hypothetical protein